MQEYKFSGSLYGGKSSVIIDGNALTIRRHGFVSMKNYGFRGDKTILISAITGTQYKPSGFTTGYLQFIVPGSIEQEGSLTATKASTDENTIIFHHKKQNSFAQEIIKYIENFNASLENKAIVSQERPLDKYDKIEKLKELLDENAITPEEYEQQKEKLLNEEE